MPAPPSPLRLDVVQLEGWVNALVDHLADRVAARLRDVNAAPVASPAKQDGPRLLGMKELRSRVSISSATIYRLIKDGKFPRPKRWVRGLLGWSLRSMPGSPAQSGPSPPT